MFVNKAGGYIPLAKATGYGAETVRQWVKGKVKPSFQGINDCAEAVGYKFELVKKNES